MTFSYVLTQLSTGENEATSSSLRVTFSYALTRLSTGENEATSFLTETSEVFFVRMIKLCFGSKTREVLSIHVKFF